MLFHSTRGNDSGRTFEEVLMQGLANDGGLFMPDYWPQINIEHIKSLNTCLLYTSPSPRDATLSRMPSSA